MAWGKPNGGGAIGPQGPKGDKGDKGDSGSASLAINDNVTNTASAWSGSKVNSMIFQSKEVPSGVTKAIDITASGTYKLIPSRLTDIPADIKTKVTSLNAYIHPDGNKVYLLQALGADDDEQITYIGYKFASGTTLYWHRLTTDKDRNFVNKKLVLLGDSIMTMVFKDVIEKRTGFTIDNLAKGGSSIALRTNVNMAPTWDPWALCTISKVGTTNSIPIENYDYAMIFIGTNDWGNSHPLGTINSTDEKTILGAYNVAIQNFISRKPDLKLLIATPMYRNNCEVPDALSNLKLSEVVAGIELLAKKYSIPVLNMLERGMINEFNKDTFLVADLLHPNEVGKDMITKKFSAFISSNY